jgi:hypothetical protein
MWMLRVSWKSALSLLVVTLFTVGASQPEGCSGEADKDRYRLPRDPADALGGNFFITGHAPDVHAVDDQGAVRLLNKSLGYVRGNSPLPFLWVESRIEPPAGHRSGKAGLNAAGLVEGEDFLHMDAAQLQAQPASWWAGMSTNFSAIVVASDKALLTQAEVDVLNRHRGDIARFMRDNRGLLALSESGTGAGLTQRDRFEFLPIEVFTTASATPPYSVTTFGHQALGLADEDVSSPAYNRFDGSFGFEIVTISDANGDIIAVAGRILLAQEYLWANAGPDGTFSGPGPFIPVVLDGAGSTSDATGLPLRYIWMIGDNVIADTMEPVTTVPLLPGEYEITLLLVNNRRDTATDEVVVTVRQAAAPTITCPANIIVPTAPAGVCGAQVNYPPPTVEAPNGVESLSCTHPTGSAFPEGVTPVTCTVVDRAGASASCGFTVTVNDREPPSLVPPPPSTSVADAQCRASIPDAVASAQASDNCTPSSALVITQTPGAGSQVTGAGTHVIQLQVSDAAGNRTTGTTTHTVLDTTPPTITRATPSRQYLWPPNHKLVPITVGVTLTDNCATSAVQCGITHVTSNEPINGRGDGNTRWDWEITSAMGVKLRAERAGLLNSRIYTIWFTCTDVGGSTVTGTTTVTVPHDQRGR